MRQRGQVLDAAESEADAEGVTENLTDTSRLLRKLATRVLFVAALAGVAGGVELAIALVLVAVGLVTVTNVPPGERRRAGG